MAILVEYKTIIFSPYASSYFNQDKNSKLSLEHILQIFWNLGQDQHLFLYFTTPCNI